MPVISWFTSGPLFYVTAWLMLCGYAGYELWALGQRERWRRERRERRLTPYLD